MRMITRECPLCRLYDGAIRTKAWYKNSICIIVDCDHCKIPMIVFSEHREPTAEEVRQMKNAASYLFPDCTFRDEKSIFDHWHKHVIEKKKGNLARIPSLMLSVTVPNSL